MTPTRTLIGTLRCLLCERPAGTVLGTRERVLRVEVADPTHAATVARRRCPECGGRLWLGETTEAPRPRPKLTPEEVRPQPGRPPITPRPASAVRLCTDCERRRAKHGASRCRSCAADRGAEIRERLDRLCRQLREALSGGPVGGPALAARLGVSPWYVRKLVRIAEKRGVVIVTEGHRYRLEAAS